MKKILILFTILIMGLTGCKKKSPEPSNSSDTPNTQVETHTVSYDVTSASGTVFVEVTINGSQYYYTDWQRSFDVKKGDSIIIFAYSGPIYYTGTTPHYNNISITISVDNQPVAGLTNQSTCLNWTKQF